MISKILQEISSDFNHILMKNDISLIVEDNSRLMLVHDDGEKYKFMDIALGENSQIEELEKDNTALRFLLAGTSNWNAIETAPKDGSEIWSYNGEQGRMKFVSGDGYSLWVWADENISDIDPIPDQPTHWIPLPPNPIEA